MLLLQHLLKSVQRAGFETRVTPDVFSFLRNPPLKMQSYPIIELGDSIKELSRAVTSDASTDAQSTGMHLKHVAP